MSSITGNQLLRRIPARTSFNRLAVTQNCAKFSDIAKSVKMSDAHADDPVPNEINLTKYDKMMLVWAGKFKKVADVPDKVLFSTFENGRNKARIKTNLSVMGVAGAGVMLALYLGKQDVQSGKNKEDFYRDFKKNMVGKPESTVGK